MTAELTRLADSVVNAGALVLKFAQVDRITFWPDGTTPESDTDHTVMLAVIGCALARRWYPHLDTGLVAEFALAHDLVEAHAGDTPTLHGLDADAKVAKRSREDKALALITIDFYAELEWIPRTILTYEAQKTPEARYVKALDKVLPKITHLLNQATTIRQQGMSVEALRARYAAQGDELAAYAGDFPELLQLRAHLVDQVLSLLTPGGRP